MHSDPFRVLTSQKKKMTDCTHTWRKKLRLQEIMVVAKREIDAGEEIDIVYEILEDEMQSTLEICQQHKAAIH